MPLDRFGRVSRRRPRRVIGQGLLSSRLTREARERGDTNGGRVAGVREGRVPRTFRGRRIGLTRRIW